MSETSTGYLTKTSILNVTVTAKPAPKLKWIKDNKELLIKDRLKVETIDVENNENTKVYKLIIDDVQPGDMGKYKIELSNKCGTESSQTDFVVKGEPAFTRKPVDLNVLEKKPAKIECEVIGIPVPTVEWYKDGVLVEKSDNIQIDVKNKTLNTLSIKSINLNSAGKYTMKAKNDIGEAECSIYLSVDGILFFIL